MTAPQFANVDNFQLRALTERDLIKYDRQLMHSSFSPLHQEKLKNARVVIAGIGGLGGPVAWSLASAGVGELALVHEGNLELPDMNRQTLMTYEGVGAPRLETAAQTLRRFNPELEIVTYNESINEEFMGEILPGCDLVIGARHNFPERRAVINAAVKHRVPAIEAAMNGLDGYFYTIIPGESACMQCVYEDDPPGWEHLGFPVFGAVSSVIGSFVAMEAIKVITGFEKIQSNAMFQINFATMEMKRLKLHKRKDCEVCSKIA